MSRDHNDIYSIVERLAILEGRITPTSVKHGLNPQQKEVPQLPALFKPKHISVLKSKTDPKHPMSGYMVGASEGAEPTVNRGGYNQLRDREDYLDKRDHLQQLLIKTTDATDKEIIRDRMADLQRAAQQAGFAEGVELEEAVATEEKLLDKVKKSFIDYIESIEDKIKQDTDLKEKIKQDTDLKSKDKKDRDLIAKEQAMAEDPTEDEPMATDENPSVPVNNPVMPESAPVKTVNMEDGRICEIHGNEVSGFEIRHGNRALPSKFKKLSEAEMALEMYMSRCRKANESQDYLDEQ